MSENVFDMEAAEQLLRDTAEDDSDVAEMIRRLTEAAARHDHVLSAAVQSMPVAAAKASEAELTDWFNWAHKQWSSQMEIVKRHGLPTGRAASSPSLLFKQIRQTWLGSVIGICVPTVVFGISTVTHGFTIPIFWLFGVIADVAGRTVCMRTAPIPRSALTMKPLRGPERLIQAVRKSLAHARTSRLWDAPTELVGRIETFNDRLERGERALERTSKAGRFLTIGSSVVLVLLALASNGLSNGILAGMTAWMVLGATFATVFGAAMWFTGATYSEANSRPPYPRPASFAALRQSILYEGALSRVPNAALPNAETIREHSTKRMHRLRDFANAVRELERSENELTRARLEATELIAQQPAIDLNSGPEKVAVSMLRDVVSSTR